MDMLTRLEEIAGGSGAAAAAVGVKAATWSNWKGRNFPEDARLRVWLALNAPRVLRKWLKERDAA